MPQVIPPIGIGEIDRLGSLERPTVEDYVVAVSAYVRGHRGLQAGPKKAAQIRMSIALGRALLLELVARQPDLELGQVGEKTIAGALRPVKADVSEFHPLDGLRLGVEIKPVNLAVGRAIWSRFGDIRTFAVNVHLKFPFAVLGGVLTLPTYEMSSSGRRSTLDLIGRAVERLRRAGGRRTEGDAAHLLEGVGVVVYDPDSGAMMDNVPPSGCGLRWPEFVSALVAAYGARFGAIGESTADENEENES